MEIKTNQSRLSLVQCDITTQNTEAIVNAANSSLMGGGGVDGAIHQAGGPAMLKACEEIDGKPLGSIDRTDAMVFKVEFAFI